MILIIGGAIQLVIGIAFLLAPAKRPNGLYGYVSYLARTTEASFKLSQKWARNALIVTGVLEMAAGYVIRLLKWENFFFIWLIVVVLLFLTSFIYTESKLKKYLKARGELPTDYIDPDEALRQRTEMRRQSSYRRRRK